MHANLQTVLIVSFFAIGYLYYIVRATARQQMDFYDLIMLSAVAIAPALFVLFPGFAEYIARITGVLFPFVIMFSGLFAILFVFVHRLTIKIHKLERDNRLLIQELSLLQTKDGGAPLSLESGRRH